MQPPYWISIQHNLQLTDMSLAAAQKQHMPFGNMSLYAAADWERSTLKKLGQLASKDPFVLLERSFDSGFGSHRRAETVHENGERGGHFSHLGNAWGRGADAGVRDGKLALFP